MQKIVRIFFIVLLLINVVYTLEGAIHYPLGNVDVYGIWLFKAKAIYLMQGFPLDFLINTKYLYSHPQYPLLFPFFVAFIYFLVGGIKEIYPLLLSPLVYTLILLVVYKTLRFLRLSDMQSLIFTYVYSMFSPLLAGGGRKLAGTVDIYLTLIYWLIAYIVLTKKLNKNSWGWLVVFLVMISSQLKVEGVFVSVLLLFLPVNIKKKILWFTISLVPSVIWLFLVNRLNIPSDIYFLPISLIKIFNHLISVAIGVIREMFNYRNWYILWPLFFVLVLTQKPKIRLIGKVIAPTFIILTLIFTAVYVYLDISTYTYVSSSVDRIMLQLSPFFYLVFIDYTRTLLTT